MEMSKAIEFLENAYDVLNLKYFNGELPKVVIVSMSNPKEYGHYSLYDAWATEDMAYREISISAETLNRKIENTIATLLHEMTHHYNAMNNIKDCSRNGTYHSKKFKEQAELRGLIIEYDPKIGWSKTTPSPELIEFIQEQGWRDVDLSRAMSGSKMKKPSSTRKYICPICGCSVRATKDVLIACVPCSEIMVLEEK